MKTTCANLVLWAVVLFSVPCLFPQPTPNPDRWANATPAAALADPDFYLLSIEERTILMRHLDPKFAKMFPDKQSVYLWKAENENLPKPPTPKQVFTWDAGHPASAAGDSVRAIEVEGIRVEASLRHEDFYCARVKFVNRTKVPLKVCPRTFTLTTVDSKPRVLIFEYPARVAHEIVRTAENRLARRELQRSPTELGSKEGKSTVPQNQVPTTAPDRSGLRTASDRANSILTNYMPEGSVDPGSATEGEVFFQRARGAKQLLLRVYAGEFAFDIPLPLQR
jgi:hypothetical protein